MQFGFDLCIQDTVTQAISCSLVTPLVHMYLYINYICTVSTSKLRSSTTRRALEYISVRCILCMHSYVSVFVTEEGSALYEYDCFC